MVVGDKEDEAVNVGEWCELLDESLARFDGFVGKLKEELSLPKYKIMSDGKLIL